MHRFEGEFWNRKYVYRKVGRHLVLQHFSSRRPEYPEQFVDASEHTFGLAASDDGGVLASEEWEPAVRILFRAGGLSFQGLRRESAEKVPAFLTVSAFF